MIPPFKLYFYPFLLCLSTNEEIKLFNIAKYIADFFNLSSDDLEEMTKLGSSSKHQSRVNYCATYLKKLGFVTAKSKGIYSITNKGLILLSQKGERLTRDDLKVLPEYIDMQINKNNPDIVYVKEHYSKQGKFVPAYWCNIKSLGLNARIQAIKDTEEKLKEDGIN